MRTLTLSLTLALLLPACAFQKAMKHGETAAAANDWARAHAAYQFANEIKPGAADTEVAAALDRVVDAELAAASTALGNGDYLGAADHIDEAADRVGDEDARVAAAREGQLAAILGDLERRRQTVSDPGELHAFVAMAQTLHPTSPELEDMAESLRARIEDESRTLVADGRYAEARALSGQLATHEPEHSTRGLALEAEVTTAWVDDLVGRAERAERGQPGLAAVYWARAHEVGGDEAHLHAAGVSLDAAAGDADLRVFVDTKGTGGRHWGLRKAVRGDLETLPGALRGYQTKYDVKATLYANTTRCDETREVKPISKEYVSGTRQVPNPAFAEVVDALDTARAALAEHESQLDEARAHAEDVRARVGELVAADAGASKKLADAKAALEATEKQIAASSERIDEARAELRATSGDSATVQEKIASLETIHGDWTRKRSDDKAALAEARATADEVKSQLEPEEERLARLNEAADAVAEVVVSDKERVGKLTTQRLETPETLTEDVIDIAKVNETTWTLTCSGPTTLFTHTAWKSQRDRKHVFEAVVATTDVEREGHAGAEIAADDKAYPKTREQLVAEVDEASRKAVVAELDALVAESFTQRVEDALGSKDPAAADTLITILASAPERVDGETRARITAWLGTQFGLENASTVGVEALPTEGAEAAEVAQGDGT